LAIFADFFGHVNYLRTHDCTTFGALTNDNVMALPINISGILKRRRYHSSRFYFLFFAMILT
jgi:hypothetical protein